MLRINVHGTTGFDGNGFPERRLVGWFDWNKAARWSDADYNGNGSGGTARGQAVILTAQGKWVLENWSSWQNETDQYEYITADEAREWLLRNNEDKAVEEHFGEIPEEEDRRGGRPEIGGRITTALGEERLGSVDLYAEQTGLSRAEAIRQLIDVGLERAS